MMSNLDMHCLKSPHTFKQKTNPSKLIILNKKG